jgi:hypothetical protein
LLYIFSHFGMSHKEKSGNPARSGAKLQIFCYVIRRLFGTTRATVRRHKKW